MARRAIVRKAPPPGSMDMRSLARLAHVLPRTVRQWIVDGLVERPPAHGYNTHYGPKSVLQVRVIAHYRERGERLGEIAQRIHGANEQELRAMLPTPDAPHSTVAAASSGGNSPRTDHGELTGEPWVAMALMPGMQLMVRADASEFVRKTAAEIAQRYRIT